MEFIKIFAVAIVGAVIFIYLKSVSSSLSGLVAVATGLVLIIFSVEYVLKSVNFFVELTSKTGIDLNSFKILIKVIFISYLADFTESLCNDMGVSSIGDKVSIVTKIIIFVVAIPIYENLFTILSGLLV